MRGDTQDLEFRLLANYSRNILRVFLSDRSSEKKKKNTCLLVISRNNACFAGNVLSGSRSKNRSLRRPSPSGRCSSLKKKIEVEKRTGTTVPKTNCARNPIVGRPSPQKRHFEPCTTGDFSPQTSATVRGLPEKNPEFLSVLDPSQTCHSGGRTVAHIFRNTKF